MMPATPTSVPAQREAAWRLGLLGYRERHNLQQIKLNEDLCCVRGSRYFLAVMADSVLRFCTGIAHQRIRILSCAVMPYIDACMTRTARTGSHRGASPAPRS